MPIGLVKKSILEKLHPKFKGPAQLPSNFIKNITGLGGKSIPKLGKIGRRFNTPALGKKRNRLTHK
jgi:hypothetical protein